MLNQSINHPYSRPHLYILGVCSTEAKSINQSINQSPIQSLLGNTSKIKLINQLIIHTVGSLPYILGVTSFDQAFDLSIINTVSSRSYASGKASAEIN